MYDFLKDLDEYFCEKYANYDKLCILPGYKMPVMQATRLDEFGRTYAYTLPSNTMRLATQENKEALLAELKTRLMDKTFSFSFQTLGFFGKIKNKLSAKQFHKNFALILARYNQDESIGELLTVPEEIWRGICKGNYLPSKNLIYSLALVGHWSLEDTRVLLALCGEDLDFAIEKDVVISYLLHNKVFHRGMIDAALAEYKIRNLFIK